VDKRNFSILDGVRKKPSSKLFDSGWRQEKAVLASAKADFPSLPEAKNLLLSTQKQLLEPPLTIRY
jgi:hypothetical protein